METPLLQLTITLKQDGMIDVTGPVHDKIACLGVLELAKTALLAGKPQARPILLARGNLPPVNGR